LQAEGLVAEVRTTVMWPNGVQISPEMLDLIFAGFGARKGWPETVPPLPGDAPFPGDARQRRGPARTTPGCWSTPAGTRAGTPLPSSPSMSSGSTCRAWARQQSAQTRPDTGNGTARTTPPTTPSTASPLPRSLAPLPNETRVSPRSVEASPMKRCHARDTQEVRRLEHELLSRRRFATKEQARREVASCQGPTETER
jgi:hypothetical protein